MSELIQKIHNLRQIYIVEDDQTELSQLEKKVKKALLVKDIQHHDGIKLILEKYAKDIDNINQLLLNDENLSVDERKLILLKRKWCEDFIKLFEVANSEVAQAETVINQNLEQAQEEGWLNN